MDRHAKPKMGFYLNDLVPQLKVEYDKIGLLNPHQVDDLSQNAPRLQIEIESMPNSESKRPKLGGLQNMAGHDIH